jgi:hypothetical protein
MECDAMRFDLLYRSGGLPQASRGTLGEMNFDFDRSFLVCFDVGAAK